MTTVSYPAVGHNGMSETQWVEMNNPIRGIVDDYTGSALALTRVNTGNIARYSLGKIAVAGYVLQVTVNEDLVVSTTAGTYYTWARYDPALNVADVSTGNANPLGPVRLGISSGLPSASGAKRYVLIDKIVRTAGQSLTAASVSRLAPWVGPSLTIPAMPPGFTASDLEWSTSLLGNDEYPLGSTLTVLSTGERFYRAIDSDTFWRAEGVQYNNDVALRSGLVAANTPPQYWTSSGGMVHFEGTAARASGSSLTNGADVILADMPAGFRPPHQVRCPCTVKKIGSGWETVNVTVTAAGVMTMYDPDGFEADYVDLSGLSYRTR